MLRRSLVWLLVLIASVSCGTWLSFNDFKDDGVVGDPASRRLGDVVTYCKETQKRVAKRDIVGERVTRAQRENEAICRLLLKMGR